MKKYEIILMDLDNTLVDDEASREYAFSKILEYKKEEVTEEKLKKFKEMDNTFWRDRAEGKIQGPEFRTIEEKTTWNRAQRFLRYFSNITFEEAVFLNTKYIEAIQEQVVELPKAKEILVYLKQKDYKVYITTNGPKLAMREKIKKIKSEEYITDYFSAEEIGFMKPRVEFFEGFMNKIQYTDRSKMIVIGDELDKDVKCGSINQIDSCWFNPKQIKNNTQYTPTYEINCLIELKNIL